MTNKKNKSKKNKIKNNGKGNGNPPFVVRLRRMGHPRAQGQVELPWAVECYCGATEAGNYEWCGGLGLSEDREAQAKRDRQRLIRNASASGWIGE
jgi:hypothetical protein